MLQKNKTFNKTAAVSLKETLQDTANRYKLIENSVNVFIVDLWKYYDEKYLPIYGQELPLNILSNDWIILYDHCWISVDD